MIELALGVLSSCLLLLLIILIVKIYQEKKKIKAFKETIKEKNRSFKKTEEQLQYQSCQSPSLKRMGL